MAKKMRRWTRTKLREWREFRGLTQEELAERADTTHASISRLENGKQPYNQDLMERIARVLQVDVPSLLQRDPGDPESIFAVLEQASPTERRQIVEIAKTLIRTGT